MTITVSRKGITLRESTEIDYNHQSGWRSVRYWEAKFDGRLSTGEQVETVVCMGDTPAEALNEVEKQLESYGWGIAD